MKKILVGLVFCLATFANAKATLQCEDSYPLFKEIIQEKTDSKHMGGVGDIYAYIQKYDYTQLFNRNHPAKQFWMLDNHLNFEKSTWTNSQWISKGKYNKRIRVIAKHNAKDSSNPYTHKLLPPKANVLTQSGEICVVPVQAYIEVEGDSKPKKAENQNTSEISVLEAMLIDHIFVRDNKDNRWRVLEFNRSITDKDFNEFFPDLPDHIKNKLNDGVVEAEQAAEEQVDN